ncbi:SH3 domain-containing protein [Romboutsia lituseburensis]|uniref:SH3 domain-containing protein n=1 Tax=Romboutsia lituseburensis TaxID=1537 RepID=UPI00215AF1E5|nr:SH3 domain-containing protein [Romboutsia lituseburensis]MCR8746311.1 SH3 domain-containing protein [Romboutsia lituseburensis]
MKTKKKLSIGSLGALALTLSSIAPVNAQSVQAQTLQNLNLRTGPSTSYSILLTLKKGTIVEVLETSNHWTLVKYNNSTGYVASNYLKNASINNNSSPSEDLSNDSLKLMECTIGNLNIRKGPSTSDSIIGKLDKTDRVYVSYHTYNGWTRIKYANGYGYVSSKFLTNIKEDVTVNLTMQCNVNSLNIRKGPSSTEPVLGSLKYKDKVNVVMNLNNGWSKINFNGGYAYVNTNYISNSVSTPSNSTFMKCNTDVLNIRSEPSKSEKIIGKLKKGEKVEVIYHLNSGWTRIKFNTSYGYVSNSYLI